MDDSLPIAATSDDLDEDQEMPRGEEKTIEDRDGEIEEDELEVYCDLQEVLDLWILSLTGDQRRMLSVVLYMLSVVKACPRMLSRGC